ncbi:hypothetical protein A1O1_02787 [Capronia coronata CBS 617.96]|uniref:Uncharacterized protein n=1 Tax=Capronia coronata CBS 617.96 TaxID=1182541 RepID=W9YPE2_9EURO|nr:uncharacterized protein A1O1_02787 [Capronia coronata CBS 617.96]EXJ94393.1 hypothetical protein A1O1_02787 [Capronia coronata CBS 617.96]
MSELLNRIETISTNIKSHLPPQFQPYLTHDNLQSFLRFIIVIAAYLLFRPHLESLFRKISGRKDPRQAEIEARIEFLKKQREGTAVTSMVMPGAQAGGAAQRNVKVVTRNGKIVGMVNEDDGKGGKKGGKGAGKGKGKKGKGN